MFFGPLDPPVIVLSGNQLACTQLNDCWTGRLPHRSIGNSVKDRVAGEPGFSHLNPMMPAFSST